MRVTPVACKLEQWVISQKMCFSIVCMNFVIGVQKFNILHYFSQKIREISYSRNVKL